MRTLLTCVAMLLAATAIQAQTLSAFRTYNNTSITSKTSPGSITAQNVGGNIDSTCRYLQKIYDTLPLYGKKTFVDSGWLRKADTISLSNRINAIGLSDLTAVLNAGNTSTTSQNIKINDGGTGDYNHDMYLNNLTLYLGNNGRRRASLETIGGTSSGYGQFRLGRGGSFTTVMASTSLGISNTIYMPAESGSFALREDSVGGNGMFVTPASLNTSLATLLATNNVYSAGQRINISGTASAPVAGLGLTAGTLATAAATVQWAPTLEFTGQAWNTSTLKSDTSAFRAIVTTTLSSAAPNGTFKLQYKANSGTYADVLSVGYNGNISTNGNLTTNGILSVVGASSFSNVATVASSSSAAVSVLTLNRTASAAGALQKWQANSVTKDSVYASDGSFWFGANVLVDGAFRINTATTTVSGSVANNAIFSQPEQGSGYKKVIVYLNNLNGTAAYTFPTAFTYTPMAIYSTGTSSANIAALSASGVTITGAPNTGYLILEGF